MIYAIATVLTVFIVALDQITKNLIVTNLVLGQSSIPILGGLFNIVFVENEGGAWGFMQNNTWLLIAITVVIMIICFAMLIKYGLHSKMFFFSIVLVLSGGIGNLIDRVIRGSVVDFIQFGFWKTFPVFNIADIAVCIGVGFLLLYFVLDIIKDFKAKKAVSDINTIIENEVVPNNSNENWNINI